MTILRTILIILMLSGTAYYVFSTICLIRHFRRRHSGITIPSPSLTVSVLKPISGCDSSLEDNLLSYLSQCSERCEVLFGVLDPGDPAVPLLRRLAQTHPHTSLHIGASIEGANHKVRILDNLARHARGEVLLITDADTRAEPGFIDRMLAPLADDSVGSVSCLYRGTLAKTPGDALEALHMTCVFAPGVASHNAFAGIDFGLGAAIAVRSEILTRAGGFAELVDYLADDFQLGRLVHKAGYRIVLSDEVIEIVLGDESIRSVLARDLRWSVTTRISRPWGHAGLVLTFGLAYAVVYLIATAFSVYGWLALMGVVSVRFAAALAGAYAAMRDKEMPRRLHLLPLRDILSFCIWVAGYMVRTVKWRGRRLRVLRHGRISPYILAFLVSWLVSGGGS